MYTATKLGDTVDKQTRRRVVTIKFSDGVSEFNKDFSFSIDTEVTTIKKTIKDYLDEINFVPVVLADGTVDFSDIPADSTPPPTTNELEKTAWQSKRTKLKELMELVRDGVFTGSELQITDLQAKVKADFKPAYLS